MTYSEDERQKRRTETDTVEQANGTATDSGVEMIRWQSLAESCSTAAMSYSIRPNPASRKYGVDSSQRGSSWLCHCSGTHHGEIGNGMCFS
jgi:hypothetical protein